MEALKVPRDLRQHATDHNDTFMLTQRPHMQHMWWHKHLLYLPMPYIHYRMRRYCAYQGEDRYSITRIFMTNSPLKKYAPNTAIYPAPIPNVAANGNPCTQYNVDFNPLTLIQSFWSGVHNGDYNYFRFRKPWEQIAELGGRRSTTHVIRVLKIWEQLSLDDIKKVDWHAGPSEYAKRLCIPTHMSVRRKDICPS